MLQAMEQVYTRPLLYDALSGEFRPPTDPKQRTHTLGRLAVATVVKGEQVVGGGAGALAVFMYEPSWAKGVESRARCSIDPKDADYPGRPVNLKLWGIQLYSETSGMLEVYDNSVPAEQSLNPNMGLTVIQTRLNPTQINFPLVLSEELSNARDAVTQITQQFFDVHGQSV